MNNKRSRQGVPSADTGAASGDFNRTQSITMPTKGGRNATTEAGRHAAGQLAPKPQNKQPLLAQTKGGASSQGGIARVQNARSSPTGKSGPAGSFTPVRNNANANLTGTAAPIQSGHVAAAPRGGPAGLRAGGRNQNYPNGTQYNQNPSPNRGRGGELSKPKRKGLGAAFYGEY